MTWRDRRVWIQLPLGYASGLPYLLVSTTLATWLATRKVDTATIGAFAAVSLPYGFKFVWAPLLDRWGDRRTWMLVFQAALGAGIAALGLLGDGSATRLAIAAVVVSFFAASQDIVVDAYRADVLPDELRAKGTAVFVFGYRLGMLAAGALALVAAAHVAWRGIYVALGTTMAVGAGATILAPPIPRAPRDRSILAPIVDLLRRSKAPLVLSIVLLYKLGYQLAAQLVQPFLVGIFPVDEVGEVVKGLGLGCTIAGGFLAGALVPRLGVRRSLLYFGVGMAASILPFALIARAGESHALLVVAVALDALLVGLAITAFDTWLMGLTRRQHSATQLALLTSLCGLPPRLLGSRAGAFAAHAGWAWFFCGAAILGLPALLLLGFLGDDDGRPR